MSVSRTKTGQKRSMKELEKLLVDGPAGRHLQAWCKRMTERPVHPVAITLAQYVVRCADGLYVLGEMSRQGLSGWAVPATPIEEWERMYRRPRSTLQQVIDEFVTIPPEWCQALGIPTEFGPVGAGTALRIAHGFLRDLRKQNTDELERELRAYLQTPQAIEEIRRNSQLMNASFDKRTMFFPQIRQIMETAIRNRDNGAFALQAHAFEGPPQTIWKRDSVRIGLTKFVLTQSQNISAINPKLLGKPLRRRDMFEAFHAAAWDQGFKRDQTLPMDEEAFSKRVTREQRFRTATGWDIFSA